MGDVVLLTMFSVRCVGSLISDVSVQPPARRSLLSGRRGRGEGQRERGSREPPSLRVPSLRAWWLFLWLFPDSPLISLPGNPAARATAEVVGSNYNYNEFSVYDG